ncbi:MAG: PucR family transcriptional regulator ligand-binding domain-containing protein [Rhodobacteraceae bacterium]|jgi:purine catabolism regulator|nr:PucR family transcriptional regulator ligand-binding domain-containing protein [Paracoccaceae bacterium]
MPLTVAQLCAMTEPQMIPRAGLQSLGNRINWIVSTEHLEPRNWLRGGEFLLMCGWNLRPSRSMYHRYIEHLHSSNLAGLGFGVGFKFERIPDQMIERANELGFPICEVPFELAFAQISRRATEFILEERYSGNNIGSLLKNGFLDEVVEGDMTLEDIAVRASHSLLCNCYFVCQRRGVIARALRNAHERLMEIDPTRRTSRYCTDSVTLELHRDDDSLSRAERVVLDVILLAAKILLRRDRAVAVERTRLTADLFDELAAQDLTPEQATRRLSAFGLSPVESYCAISVRLSRDARPADLAPAEELVSTAAGTKLLTNRGNALEAIWAPKSARAQAQLSADLAGLHPTVSFGIGEIVAGVDVQKSVLQARHIAKRGGTGIFGKRAAGVEDLLAITDKVAARDFATSLLGKSLQHDSLHEIEKLLDAGFNINETASQLGIHRHTLRTRIERFVDVSGLDIRQPEIRPKVWLALKLARLHGESDDLES